MTLALAQIGRAVVDLSDIQYVRILKKSTGYVMEITFKTSTNGDNKKLTFERSTENGVAALRDEILEASEKLRKTTLVEMLG